MFGSEVIDAAIGLFLVFFLFSLLCSAINELIIGHLASLRASTLDEAIKRMLIDTGTAGDFFQHPLIRGLCRNDRAKPSYISAATFVDTFLALVESKAKAAKPTPAGALPGDVVPAAAAAAAGSPVIANVASDVQKLREAVGALPSTDMQLVLRSLLNGSTNMDDARKKLEQWFNDAMDRASGWYKKKIQWFLALWALIVAVLFNVDTFSIAQALLNNPKLRASLVAAAEEIAKQSATNTDATPQQTIEAVERRIRDLELPIGWSSRVNVSGAALTSPKFEYAWLRAGETPMMKIAGLLVTAGALSFGAPFWFDLLNKVVNLRAAGKKPEPEKDAQQK